MMHSYYLLSVCIAFILTLICIPSIVSISVKKHLFEEFNERTVHKKVVPSLGGVAIFIGFIVSVILSSNSHSLDEIKYIIVSIFLMFFIGLKDDLITVSNRKKFLIQVFAALLLIFLGKIRLSHFHGFLGLYDVDLYTGSLATLFLMILTINAYNLIDGIDGLASGLAILGSFAFGMLFVMADEFEYAIMSFALMGSLIAFFIFNVFGTKNKIFMGDTGSLVIGLAISALLIKFNEIDSSPNLHPILQKGPTLSFAIVLVPLIDTLRVFAIRIKRGKSPFAPDTNHVHHRLLRLFGNHLKVSLTIIAVNLAFILLALALNYTSLDIHFAFLTIIALALFASYIPVILINRWKKNPDKIVYNL